MIVTVCTWQHRYYMADSSAAFSIACTTADISACTIEFAAQREADVLRYGDGDSDEVLAAPRGRPYCTLQFHFHFRPPPHDPPPGVRAQTIAVGVPLRHCFCYSTRRCTCTHGRTRSSALRDVMVTVVVVVRAARTPRGVYPCAGR